jgi:hypothetical protein
MARANLALLPQALAEQAGLAIDVYSLARMVASEGYSTITPTGMLALAEAARNEAQRRGISVTQLLTTVTKDGPHASGFYGRQEPGTWASTYQDPTPASIAAAKQALEQSSNVAQGATDFFDPYDQRLLHKKNPQKWTLTDQDYIAKQIRAGLDWIGEVKGINSDRLFLMGRNVDSPTEYTPETSDTIDDSPISEDDRGHSEGGTGAVLAILLGIAFGLTTLYFYTR